jgi:hypothetical protein
VCCRTVWPALFMIILPSHRMSWPSGRETCLRCWSRTRVASRAGGSVHCVGDRSDYIQSTCHYSLLPNSSHLVPLFIFHMFFSYVLFLFCFSLFFLPVVFCLSLFLASSYYSFLYITTTILGSGNETYRRAWLQTCDDFVHWCSVSENLTVLYQIR